MSDEVIEYVDSLAEVKITKKQISKNGKIETSIVRKVANVITREGRKGVAVEATHSKDGEIGFVTVRYTECPEGDVYGRRCISEGEQRQHYPTDLTVIEIPIRAKEQA